MTIINLTLEWQGITIDITHDDEWLNMPDLQHYVHHIKVQRRDEGPLPITETGYRSIFLQGVNKVMALDPYPDALSFVTACLDAESRDKAWLDYIDSQKQLSLF